jgi:hypothetical protein
MKTLYENTKCTEQVNGLQSDRFDVNTGVQQGAIASPVLFNFAIDWVMKKAVAKCLLDNLKLASPLEIVKLRIWIVLMILLFLHSTPMTCSTLLIRLSSFVQCLVFISTLTKVKSSQYVHNPHGSIYKVWKLRICGASAIWVALSLLITFANKKFFPECVWRKVHSRS